jgi:hypothetical protein
MGPSLGSKKTKILDANEKNLNWLPKEYTQFVRTIAIKYYVQRLLKMLQWEFLDNSMDGYVELCKDLCCELLTEFDVSEKFNNYLDYGDH